MKSLFIQVKSKQSLDENLLPEILKELPKNIIIAYSIQYKELASEIKDKLSKTKNILSIIQVLGCSQPKIPKSTQAILLISDGKFHGTSLALETGKPVYVFNGSKLEQISESDINKLKQQKKISYMKYLHADKVGILISTKPGQQNLNKAIDIKKQLKKESYLFICNNVNTTEFENFPQIQSWINTACPRLDLQTNKLINISKI